MNNKQEETLRQEIGGEVYKGFERMRKGKE